MPNNKAWEILNHLNGAIYFIDEYHYYDDLEDFRGKLVNLIKEFKETPVYKAYQRENNE